MDELTLMAHKSIEEPDSLPLARAKSDDLPQAAAEEEEEVVKKSEELTLEEKRALRVKEQEAIKKASKRLGTYLQGNYFIISTACFFSVGAGCLMPLFALFLADMITVLAKYDYFRSVGINKGHPEWEKNKEQALLVGMYFIVIAVASLITYFFQLGLFTKIAQQITTRLRRDLYQQFITGTSNRIYQRLVCGLVIAFISSWRLSLVALSVSPLLIVSGIIKSKYYNEKFKNEEKNDTKEAKTFQESCTNTKTISSLNAQAEIKKKFEAAVDKEVFQTNGRLVGEAALLGVGGFAIFGIYALCFYAGSQFVRDYGLGYNEFFRALFAILFGASGAGQSQQQSADIPEAEKADYTR